MVRPMIVALLLPGALAGGCARRDDAAPAVVDRGVDIGLAANAAQDAIDAYGANVGAGVGHAVPRPPPRVRPPSAAAPAPDSAAAADVVRRYYALIGEGDYARARALWEPGAAGAGASEAAFAATFARYAAYRALVGAPGAVDAGAGQRYVTVPVEIAARPARGEAVVAERASVTLHRVGDIDGATVAERSWHLHGIETQSAAAAAASNDARTTPATPDR